MKAKFVHSSMFGSYYLSCTVLEKKKNRSKISYHDPYVNEICEIWIDNEWLEIKRK